MKLEKGPELSAKMLLINFYENFLKFCPLLKFELGAGGLTHNTKVFIKIEELTFAETNVLTKVAQTALWNLRFLRCSTHQA